MRTDISVVAYGHNVSTRYLGHCNATYRNTGGIVPLLHRLVILCPRVAVRCGDDERYVRAMLRGPGEDTY